MDVCIKNSTLFGEIKAIPSKSYAHRIAICRFLAGLDPRVNLNGFTSADIEATENCLIRLLSGQKVLDCNESGSTLRFLLPLLSSCGGEFELIGSDKLFSRPNGELFKVLQEHGIKINQSKKIYLRGKLGCGDFAIRGDVSSQYISGLLMALPTLDGDSRITLTSPLVSKPYVDITIEVLNSFGVSIKEEKDGYFVKGNQTFLKNDILPEGDWSNSAFFLVGGAISDKGVTVSGLKANSVQGDRKIVEILLKAGAEVCVSENGITVKKGRLESFKMDFEDCPDLVPICAVLASFASGETVIKNVERLKIKESDRIESTLKMLYAFNVEAKSYGKDIIIKGGQIKSGQVDSFNDHRIAMASAILALGVNDGKNSIITDAYAVNKSYPNFYKDYNLLGGKASDL